MELKAPQYEPAVRMLRESKFQEVIQLGAKLLQEKPDDASAHLLIALAYVGLEKPLQAMDQASLASGHGRNDAVGILQILATTYSRSGKYYTALACLTRAEKIVSAPEVIHDMAKIYLSQGRAAKARPLLASLPADKADPETLSRTCLMLGDLPAAEVAARRALDINPENAGALLLLGTAQLLSGESKLAETSFRHVKKAGKDNIMVGHFLALAAFAQRDYTTSLAETEALLKSSPRLREAHLIDGLAWHMQAKYALARKSTALALADSPGDAIASLLMAAHWLGEGRKDEALRFLPGGEPFLYELANPTASDSSFGTDWSADQAGRFVAAVYLMTEGLARDALDLASEEKEGGLATHPFLTIAKARAELALGRRASALASLTALTQTHPSLVTPWMELAQLAATDGQAESTRGYLQQALARPVKSLRLQLVAGELAYRAQLYDLAESCFRRATIIDPKSAISKNQLAWTLAAKLHRPDEALPVALEACQLAPGNSNAIDTLAWVHHLLGQHQEAVKIYQPLLKSLPHNASTLYHMGKVFEKAGQPAIAAELLEKALSLSDEFPGAVDASLTLNSLWASS